LPAEIGDSSSDAHDPTAHGAAQIALQHAAAVHELGEQHEVRLGVVGRAAEVVRQLDEHPKR
jgi:hypothetical protein